MHPPHLYPGICRVEGGDTDKRSPLSPHTHILWFCFHNSRDRFRFDFTHFSQTTAKELAEIETIVNQRIRANVPVETVEMDAEEAFKSNATALFEEKYGDRVRMVSLEDFSKELCGGTHTGVTGNIGLFKIIEESSVALQDNPDNSLLLKRLSKYYRQRLSLLTTASHLAARS